MGRVLTNNTALSYAIEATEDDTANIGLLPGESGLPGTPTWFTLEPNTFGTIGANITTVARNPISRLRQRRKGTTTDLDSAAEFEADLTLSHFNDFIEGFIFSLYTGAEEFDPSAVDADSYTVAAGSALTAGTLVYGRAFGIVANNGLKVVDAAATTTDIPVTTALTVEVTPPDEAVVEVAGFRTAAGDLAATVSGATVTITSVADIFNDSGLSLTPGSAIFFGGEAALNRFTDTANVGYARIVSVATDGSQIVIDKTGQTWVTEAAVIQEVDFYIGKFVRNVPTDAADVGVEEFLERSFQFEISYPNLETGPADGYEYSRGNYSNTLGLNIPLTEKATMSFGFTGIDTDPITGTQKTNADTPLAPVSTGAFNTTADCARLRITEVDETGLTTDFKSLTINLNNNVSPEKVLCSLGARFMNFGNFEVDIEAQVLFTNSAVTAAIRANTTLTMDFALKNDDGAIYMDIPALTLGGGGRDFPINETVLINLTGAAFVDPILNTSIGVTVFPFIPDLS